MSTSDDDAPIRRFMCISCFQPHKSRPNYTRDRVDLPRCCKYVLKNERIAAKEKDKELKATKHRLREAEFRIRELTEEIDKLKVEKRHVVETRPQMRGLHMESHEEGACGGGELSVAEEHWKTLERRNKLVNGKCLLIGDSMIKFVSEECRCRGIKVKCYPGIRTEQLRKKVEKMTDERGEDLVVLHVGTCSIKSCKSPEDVVSAIYDLCLTAKKKFKYAKIVVSGVIRRKDVSRAKVDYINDYLDWICKSKGIFFVDPNGWLGEEDMGRDGTQLNRNGTRKFSRLLEDLIDYYLEI